MIKTVSTLISKVDAEREFTAKSLRAVFVVP
jgi:hypothetical protein